MPSSKKVKHNAEDVFFLVFGKKPRAVVRRGFELFARDMADRIVDGVVNRVLTASESPQEVPENPSYIVLGLHPDAYDSVVKAAFRQLAHELHPDTGAHPDAKKFQAVKEAYDSIMAERAAKKVEKDK